MLILSLIYVTVGLAYCTVTPILEKSDEQGHYGYLLYLREFGTLPPLLVSDELSFEYKQPPLYYSIVWALSGVLPSAPATSTISLDRNPYVDYAVPGIRGDNRVVYLHPPNQTALGVLGRLVSLAFGLGTMILAYFLAREVIPTQTAAHYATAMIVGFQPRFLYMATAVNNDASAAFFGAALTYLLVLRIKRSSGSRLHLAIAAILGLAVLAKSSCLLFVPLVALVLITAPGHSVKERLTETLIALSIAALIGGWWYARNALSFGDPLTIGTHLNGGDLSIRALEDRLSHDLPSIEYTFWANLARTTVAKLPLDSVLIWWGRLSSIALVLALWLRNRFVRRPTDWSVVAFLVAIPLSYLAALVGYWTRTQAFAFGRLILPALAAMATLWSFGWARLLAGPWRSLVLRVSGGLMVCVSLAVPLISIRPLYQPYRRFEPHRIETLVDWRYYDSGGHEIARLVGYSSGISHVVDEQAMSLEVCWLPVNRTSAPASVFVHVVDASQVDTPTGPPILGARRTYPGLGNQPTDRWAPGAAFCDPLLVPVSSDIGKLPIQTMVEVGLIEGTDGDRFESRGADGAVVLPMLPGPSLVSADDVDVGELAPLYVFSESIVLHSIEVALVDRDIVLETIWQSRQYLPYDAVIFVHVRDRAGALVAQLDVPPLGGRYQTSAWIPRQILTDRLVVPLPEESHGPYSLYLGMYERDSQQRLPVVDSDGTTVDDGVIAYGETPGGVE